MQALGVGEDAVEIEDDGARARSGLGAGRETWLRQRQEPGLLAFAVASRLSATPKAVPVIGCTQIDCADPWLPCMRTSWPMARSFSTTSAVAPLASIVSRSGSH